MALCWCTLKLLLLGGIDNCRIPARGHTATLGNFTFDVISNDISTDAWPQTWKEIVLTKSLSGIH